MRAQQRKSTSKAKVVWEELQEINTSTCTCTCTCTSLRHDDTIIRSPCLPPAATTVGQALAAGSSHGWLLLRVDASTPRPRGHTLSQIESHWDGTEDSAWWTRLLTCLDASKLHVPPRRKQDSHVTASSSTKHAEANPIMAPTMTMTMATTSAAGEAQSYPRTTKWAAL